MLAVDDEPLALQRIEWCLAEFPDVELAGKARSGPEALALARSLRPDLLLLDIDMPVVSGLEVVEKLEPGQALEIVFVTAFDEFAVRAFELSATDYLLKPVEHERLGAALARARARLSGRASEARVAELQAVVAKLRAARHATAEPRYETEFWVAERDARVRIPAEMVERIEAYGDYVRLQIGERERLMRAKLGDLEARLDPARFVRIHRSRIVRSDLIVALRRTPTGRARVVLVDGSELPVSRSQIQAVRERLRVRA